MTDQQEPRLVFCSCPNDDVAGQIAKTLVLDKLAACVNVVPGLHSVYTWEDKLCEETECLLLIKTTSGQMRSLQDAIMAIHPYELPEIIAVPISAGLPAYLDWITASVKDSA